MQTTYALAWFLASWAKVLSWREVAKRFHSTWDTVFRCVEHAVVWGLAHRNLDGVVSIGVDEFAWKKRHKYLTLVYQIDHRCKRLSVGQLAVRAHVTSPSVSHHLRKLLEGELVRIERRGRCTLVRRNEHRWQMVLGAFAAAE
jgi:DNA-binding transcriptional ArsR family regulator